MNDRIPAAVAPGDVFSEVSAEPAPSKLAEAWPVVESLPLAIAEVEGRPGVGSSPVVVVLPGDVVDLGGSRGAPLLFDADTVDDLLPL